MIDGWRYVGYRPAEGEDDEVMGRRHAEDFLELLSGRGFAQPNPRPMFANPPGLLRLEPHSEGLRDRIWWGAGSNATAVWAAKLGMNLQSSRSKKKTRRVSRSISNKPRRFARFVQRGRKPATLGRPAFREPQHFRIGERSWPCVPRAWRSGNDAVGFLDAKTRAIFGRTYAAEPDVLIEQLRKDDAMTEANTLLLTVPNQLGVAYNAHVMEAVLKNIAPSLGWR